jgi:hypothetical protein
VFFMQQQQIENLRSAVDKEFENLREEIDRKFKLLDERLEDGDNNHHTLREVMFGNGEPWKGIVVRVDRLEQSHERRVWLTRTALAASVSALVGIAGMVMKALFFP